MPFVSEALRFAESPSTSVDQLRRACEILSLDTSGTLSELRARLLTHLNTLDSEAPVLCLNPNVGSDLVGSVTGLPPELSERSGEKFAMILQDKVGRR